MEKRHAFTLIEMVLVVTIIALLATLVLTRMTGRAEQAKKATARVQVRILKSALSDFDLNCSRLPTTLEGLEALIKRPVDLPDTVQWTPCLDEPRVPLDPWGRPYAYRCPGVVNPDGFDLFSLGPDGKEATDDDIGNTTK